MSLSQLSLTKAAEIFKKFFFYPFFHVLKQKPDSQLAGLPNTAGLTADDITTHCPSAFTSVNFKGSLMEFDPEQLNFKLYLLIDVVYF